MEGKGKIRVKAYGIGLFSNLHVGLWGLGLLGLGNSPEGVLTCVKAFHSFKRSQIIFMARHVAALEVSASSGKLR